MLGCVYLILALLLGREIAGNLLSCQKIKEKGITPFWVLFSAAYGCGVLLLTWAVYIAAWLLSVYGGSNTPLFGANLIVMTAAAVFLAYLGYRRREALKDCKKKLQAMLPPWKEILFFVLLLGAITWIMYYVFHISDGVLYSGFSVFGDYAPHTRAT